MTRKKSAAAFVSSMNTVNSPPTACLQGQKSRNPALEPSTTRRCAPPLTRQAHQPQSAWDNADPLTRPPLDALRIQPERAIHILDGDATGGGHRYGAGKPGKTEFPANWDEDKIIDSILSVARSPDSASPQRNGRWLVEGVRDQVALAVVIVADGRIWTAYPLPGSPGVRQNPRNQ